MSHASRKFLGAMMGGGDATDASREELRVGEERGVTGVFSLFSAADVASQIVGKHFTDAAFPEGGGDRRPVVDRSADLTTLKSRRYWRPGPFLSCLIC